MEYKGIDWYQHNNGGEFNTQLLSIHRYSRQKKITKVKSLYRSSGRSSHPQNIPPKCWRMRNTLNNLCLLGFYCCINSMTKKVALGGKGWFQAAFPGNSSSLRGSQEPGGRNWSRDHWRVLLTSLAFMVGTVWFLIENYGVHCLYTLLSALKLGPPSLWASLGTSLQAFSTPYTILCMKTEQQYKGLLQ